MQEEETWVCPKCKTYNEQYLEACSCGVKKEDIEKTRTLLRRKRRKTIIASIAVALLLSMLIYGTFQFMKFIHPLRKIENRKWRVASIKFHDGYVLTPNLDAVDTCLLFAIRKGGKYYRFSTDDCCNTQGGRIVVNGQKIIVASKITTQIACMHGTFYDFRSVLDRKQKFETNPSFDETTLYTMAYEWNGLFNDTLNLKRVEDELFIWNAKGDTAILTLSERPPDGYGWSLSFF